MFLPIPMSTIVLIVFVMNALFLSLFKTDLEVILKYLLYVIFFSALCLTFIVILLYGLNIRVFSTFFIGSFISLLFNRVYESVQEKNTSYYFKNIFLNIFIYCFILGLSSAISIYIAGAYGLAMMFFGLISYNGVFISSMIIYHLFSNNKSENYGFILQDRSPGNSSAAAYFYSKKQSDTLKYTISQVGNAALILLIVFTVKNNLSLINIISYYTIGGLLIGYAVFAFLIFFMYNLAYKKNISLQSSNKDEEKIPGDISKNKFVIKLIINSIQSSIKNIMIKAAGPYLILLVVLFIMCYILNSIIVIPFFLGLYSIYIIVSLFTLGTDLNKGNNMAEPLFECFKNYSSIFGSDIMKFVALIILLYRFGV
jgi:hypothetical protein